MLATDAAKIMQEQGVTPPQVSFRKETILGATFDSSEPEEYLKSVRKPT
jgi:nitrate/nitrite transport system substrate-binding protein